MVFDALLDVLVAAHAKGIVHRDIEAGKHLSHTLGFGEGARLRDRAPPGGPAQPDATESGATMGTPAFMPPEQARGLWDEVDGQSDVWAVGATMFTLLSGRQVHEGRTTNEVLLAAMTRAPRPLGSVASHVSEETRGLVDHALAFDKNTRPDAQALQVAVRRAYQRRTGAMITTAARLQVPATLLVGEFPPSSQPRTRVQASSVSAVVTPPRADDARFSGPPAEPLSLPPPAPGIRSRPWLAALLAGCALTLVAAVACVALVVRLSTPAIAYQPPAAALRPVPVPVPVVLPGPTPSLSSSSAPPTEAIASTPTATAAAPSSPPAAPPTVVSNVASRPAGKQAPATSNNVDCTPPYVVNPATGKKKWKPECL